MLKRTVAFALLYVATMATSEFFTLVGSDHFAFLPAAGIGLWWCHTSRDRNEWLLTAGLLFVLTLTPILFYGNGVVASVLYAAAGTALCAIPWPASRALHERPPWPGGPVLASSSGDHASLVSVADCHRLFFALLPAIAASGVLSTLGHLSADNPATFRVWLQLTLQAVSGVVLVAGPCLAFRSRDRDARRASAWELLALLVVTVMVQWLVFGSGSQLPVGYASLILVFWSGLRLPLATASVHGSLMSTLALTFVIITNRGPFSSIGDLQYREIATQGYMIMVGILVIIVSAAMGDRGRLLRSLRVSQRRAIAKAEEAERLFSDSPQGVALMTKDGTLLRANDALGRLLGRTTNELAGATLRDLSHEDAAHLHRFLDRAVAHPDQHVEGDWTFTDPSGSDVHVSFTSKVLSGYDDGADAVLVNVIDLSERRRYEKRLAYLADHDVLTSLANRRRFEEALTAHQRTCDRYGDRGALLLLDLDHFKEVNDTLGHPAGDALIANVASALRRSFRSTDLVARLGGDEFAVLLPEADQAAAEVAANNIIERIQEQASTLDGVHRRVTASVGVVTFAAVRKLDSDPMALVDLLMYDAKEAGRNQFATLDENEVRQPRTAARMAWRSRLERALDEDLFELHLQPILDLRQDRITGAEALIRLADGPELVLPGRFIYIAEQTDLSTELDVWVVRRAVETLAGLRRADPDFILEVNVSGHSIGDPRLEQAVVESLREHGVDPRALVLEVTETAAVAEVELARNFARRITAAGSRFALDDFGAGFGSFYYLKHLDFDFIKIDGEFVAHAHASDIDEAIVRSIVGIARDLGKLTVAEFVAEPAVLQAVRELGVDYAQGYLIGRPVTADKFTAQFLGPDKRFGVPG